MKIALICPSNLLYMPYVDNYKKVLNKTEVDYDIINWDRFHIEPKDNPLTYRDSKIGHSRNIIDYIKYKKFVVKKLNDTKYNRVIVFGIQLAFFLKTILKKYKDNYILDIRDYNKIIRFFNIKPIINNSKFTVISSPGFKQWLPRSNKYTTNHNTRIESIEDITDTKHQLVNNGIINISYIGTIRDLAINIKLIDSLKNVSGYNVNFHGEGIINKEIKTYIEENEINNVFLTGRYKRESESELYMNSDIVNVLIPNTDLNSRTLLPNRLYNSVVLGKPILTYKGTFLAEVVAKYSLGLVIDSFSDLDEKIENYISAFDKNIYIQKRFEFLNKIINENESFEVKLGSFIAL